MAAAFGFSAGDFIAAISLVRDLGKALHDSNGSSREYRELIRELHSLETSLLEVKALDLEVERKTSGAQTSGHAMSSQYRRVPEGARQISASSTIGRLKCKLERCLSQDSVAHLYER